MSRTRRTIQQLYYLAENWNGFSTWTRTRIFLIVFWYVKVQRPLVLLADRLGLKPQTRQFLLWLPAALLFGVLWGAWLPEITSGVGYSLEGPSLLLIGWLMVIWASLKFVRISK